MIEQEWKTALGKNIKFFRFRRELSQSDLAEKVCISVTALSSIERGNTFPQPSTFCNLAEALKVQVWELFRGEGASEQETPIVDRYTEDIIKQIEMVQKQYKA
jgi:transcriptional regulator with XRE-family HTH domain